MIEFGTPHFTLEGIHMYIYIYTYIHIYIYRERERDGGNIRHLIPILSLLRKRLSGCRREGQNGFCLCRIGWRVDVWDFLVGVVALDRTYLCICTYTPNSTLLPCSWVFRAVGFQAERRAVEVKARDVANQLAVLLHENRKHATQRACRQKDYAYALNG